MKTKKHKGIESLKSRYGLMFVTPWLIGLVLFFAIPLINSVRFSFSDVSLTNSGIVSEFTGISHYRRLVTEDAQYVNNLTSSLSDFAYSLPLIVILSLVLAVILNQKFHGQVFARAIFFLPVIIATGVIMTLMTSEYMEVSVVATSTETSSGAYTSEMIDFDSLLSSLGIKNELAEFFSKYIGNIFNLIWSCGIQIVLFIAGLQTIPEQLYEASRVEGATKWEEFWLITLPMLSQVLILVVVYTAVDLLTSSGNRVMTQAYDLMQNSRVYDKSSAMLWTYFLIIGLVMTVLFLIYKKLCLKRWE